MLSVSPAISRILGFLVVAALLPILVLNGWSGAVPDSSAPSIGILGDVPSAVLAELLSEMPSKRPVKIGDITFYQGTLAGKDVIVARTGEGMTNAVTVTQMLFDHFRVGRVILFGGGGEVAPGAVRVGDIHIPHTWVTHDTGLLTDEAFHHFKVKKSVLGENEPSVLQETAQALLPALQRMESSLAPGGLLRRAARKVLDAAEDEAAGTVEGFRVDAGLLRAARKASSGVALRAVGGDVPRVMIGGVGVSGHRVPADEAMRRQAVERFKAGVVDLDSSAVVMLAHINHVPILVVRAGVCRLDHDDAGEIFDLKRESSREALRNVVRFVLRLVAKMPARPKDLEQEARAEATRAILRAAPEAEIGMVVHFRPGDLADQEIFIARLKDLRKLDALGRTFYSGTWAGKKVVLAGRSDHMTIALMAGQVMIDRFKVRKLLHFENCGGISDDTVLGDVYAPETWITHDHGLITEKGMETRAVRVGDRDILGFSVDPNLLGLLRKAAKQVSLHPVRGQAPSLRIGGVGVAGHQWIGSDKYRTWLIAAHRAKIVDLAGSGLAQLALVNHVPFIAFKSCVDFAGKEGARAAKMTDQHLRYPGHINAALVADALLKLLPAEKTR